MDSRFGGFHRGIDRSGLGKRLSQLGRTLLGSAYIGLGRFVVFRVSMKIVWIWDGIDARSLMPYARADLTRTSNGTPQIRCVHVYDSMDNELFGSRH
jgi:hypothetical protein